MSPRCESPPFQSWRAGETHSSRWHRRFLQSQSHMKTKPSTKPEPELLDSPVQGSKPQHQNPSLPMSTLNSPGESLHVHHWPFQPPPPEHPGTIPGPCFQFYISAVNKAVVIHPLLQHGLISKAWLEVSTNHRLPPLSSAGNHWFGCRCSCPDRNCLPPPLAPWRHRLARCYPMRVRSGDARGSIQLFFQNAEPAADSATKEWPSSLPHWHSSSFATPKGWMVSSQQ